MMKLSIIFWQLSPLQDLKGVTYSATALLKRLLQPQSKNARERGIGGLCNIYPGTVWAARAARPTRKTPSRDFP